MKNILLYIKKVLLTCLLLFGNMIYGQNLKINSSLASGDFESCLYAFNCCIYSDSVVNYAGDIKVYLLIKSQNNGEILYQLDPLHQKELKHSVLFSCELILKDNCIYSYKYYCKNLDGNIFYDTDEYFLSRRNPIDP